MEVTIYVAIYVDATGRPSSVAGALGSKHLHRAAMSIARGPSGARCRHAVSAVTLTCLVSLLDPFAGRTTMRGPIPTFKALQRLLR